jgi:molybdopterin-guanine dinucleotide biosynthesis protein A
MAVPAVRDAPAGVRAVVLAGGASRRMGVDKATLVVDGVAMARRVADAAMAGGCSDVVAVGGEAEALEAMGLTVIPDRWPGEGPLGAILVAVEHARSDVVVLACDLVWLDGDTVGHLLRSAANEPEVDVVCAWSDRLEPLCALWRPSALDVVTETFRSGERAVHVALARLRTASCRVRASSLRNANTPSDLLGDNLTGCQSAK